MWVWALLPVLLAVFGTVGIWAVFGIAVSNESVNLTAEFPYISTCGAYNPQSCLFSQICNICSVLALWIVTIRFQQVRDLGCVSRVNTCSLVLGFISSIGISVLGNFQQSVVMKAHLLGAFLAFFVGVAYFWIQVWLTYRAEPSHDKKWAGPARIIFCSLCTVLIIAMSVLHNIGYRSEAAICEWAAVMSFFVLFGVFTAEFRHIDFHELHVQHEAKSSSDFPMNQVH
ncbi:modulator of macroautophagy TMEM150B [Salminus brasiliensis]|uniref:modulator of macroautophagy TMEM150B n=1 Tax=Salminus brasiliensis TaxID=930266 RepID=UPI003B830666